MHTAFYLCIFVIGWYVIHFTVFPPEITILLGNNYIYSIKSGQTAVFKSQNIIINSNEYLKCILYTAYSLGEIDIKIYISETLQSDYLILNKTITHNKALTRNFYNTEKIQHMSNKWEYLIINCS